MFNIAIDGVSGSGKSTIATALAKKLKMNVLNTGDLYRAFACAYRDMDLGKVSKKSVEALARQIDTDIKFIKGVQHTFANGVDYTASLHDEEISVLVPEIALFKCIREEVKEIQRRFAKNNDCIIEGRDITYEILPHADLKLFITASPEVRAKRRLEQVKDSGKSYEEILKDLKKRDHLDMHRKVSPLKIVKDAVVVDTGDMTVEETVDYILKLVKEKQAK